MILSFIFFTYIDEFEAQSFSVFPYAQGDWLPPALSFLWLVAIYFVFFYVLLKNQGNFCFSFFNFEEWKHCREYVSGVYGAGRPRPTRSRMAIQENYSAKSFGQPFHCSEMGVVDVNPEIEMSSSAVVFPVLLKYLNATFAVKKPSKVAGVEFWNWFVNFHPYNYTCFARVGH